MQKITFLCTEREERKQRLEIPFPSREEQSSLAMTKYWEGFAILKVQLILEDARGCPNIPEYTYVSGHPVS
jgi:hypothetical protein